MRFTEEVRKFRGLVAQVVIELGDLERFDDYHLLDDESIDKSIELLGQTGEIVQTVRETVFLMREWLQELKSNDPRQPKPQIVPEAVPVLTDGEPEDSVPELIPDEPEVELETDLPSLLDG